MLNKIQFESIRLLILFWAGYCAVSAANAPRLNKVQHQGTAAYSKVTLRLSGVPIVKPYWSTTGVSVVLEGAELSRGLPAKVNVQSRIVRRVRTGLSNLGSPYVAIDAVPGITLKTEVVVDRATVVLTIHPAEADRHHIDLVVSGRTPPAGPVVRLTGVRSIERDRGRRIEFTFTAPPRIQEVRTNDKFIMRFPAVMADRNVPERVKTSWPLAPLLLLENGPKGLKAELALTGSSSVQCVASVRGNSVDVLLTETAALNPTRRPKTESAADSVAVMTSSERFPSPRPSERLLLASNGAAPYTRLNDGTPLPFPPSPSQLLVLLRSEHLRVKLNSDIERIAVGDPSLLHAEPIGTRELLLLGKGWGLRVTRRTGAGARLFFLEGRVSAHFGPDHNPTLKTADALNQKNARPHPSPHAIWTQPPPQPRPRRAPRWWTTCARRRQSGARSE